MKWTQKNAKVEVETGKEGALAAKGHELRIGFKAFEISYDAETREMLAVVSAASASVLGVIDESGNVVTHILSVSDAKKIEKKISESILESARFPAARFEANIPDILHNAAVSGKLTLCGTTRPVTFEATIDEGYVSTSFIISQSDFGIKQYSALLGALKVSDQVKVYVQLDISDLKK